MSSIRLRINGTNVASVNEQLLEFYKHHTTSLKDSPMPTIIRSIVEANLLCRPIMCEKDIIEAKNLAANSFYNSVGEWVEGWIHEQIQGILPLCRNCSYRGENDFCPILNAFINPNCKSCSNICVD